MTSDSEGRTFESCRAHQKNSSGFCFEPELFLCRYSRAPDACGRQSVLDLQEQLAVERGDHRLDLVGDCLAALLDLGIGAPVAVALLVDVRPFGQVHLEDEGAGDGEHVQAALDVGVGGQVLADVAVDGAHIAHAVDLHALGALDAQRLKRHVGGDDLVLVPVGGFVGELGQPRAGTDDAVVEALGVGIPVVLPGAVQALDGDGHVDEAQQRGVLPAPARQRVQPAVKLRKLLRGGRGLPLGIQAAAVGEHMAADRIDPLLQLAAPVALADEKGDDRILDAGDAVEIDVHGRFLRMVVKV